MTLTSTCVCDWRGDIYKL